jgi:hypothetical protein
MAAGLGGPLWHEDVAVSCAFPSINTRRACLNRTRFKKHSIHQSHLCFAGAAGLTNGSFCTAFAGGLMLARWGALFSVSIGGYHHLKGNHFSEPLTTPRGIPELAVTAACLPLALGAAPALSFGCGGHMLQKVSHGWYQQRRHCPNLRLARRFCLADLGRRLPPCVVVAVAVVAARVVPLFLAAGCCGQ